VAFNEHDLDAIVSHFAEDCVLEIPRGPDRWGCRFVGREEVRRGDFVFRRRPLASRRTPRPVQLRLVFS
jgi:ketosteroid isomerase-like protein